MSTQSPTRCPDAPLSGTESAQAQRIAERAGARSGHIETSLAHASQHEAAYGCVDWFIYEKSQSRQ